MFITVSNLLFYFYEERIRMSQTGLDQALLPSTLSLTPGCSGPLGAPTIPVAVSPPLHMWGSPAEEPVPPKT